MENHDRQLSATEKALGGVLRTLLVVAILGGAFFVARHWLTNRPTAQRQPPARLARFVEVRALHPQERSVIVNAMGEVRAATEVSVAAEVAGRIVSISLNLVPGGRLSEGEELARIEAVDYELAVAQAEASLRVTQAELMQELGQQAVARNELELLGDENMNEDDRALVLREPQLQTAQAAVASAENALAQARLDLARTRVRAPFDCVIRSRSVERGARVNSGTTLAELIGTEVYWIDAAVALDELHWIDVPGMNAEDGAPVRVFHESAWGDQEYRMGRVYRLRPSLETAGRMARVLIEVDDPLDTQSEIAERRPLVLGAYVSVEIIGQTMPHVVAIARENVHDGNTVWLMNDDGTLDVRRVEIVWSDDENVYVDGGLEDGDMLVTSDIATPVAGMKLRTNGGGNGNGNGNAKQAINK